METYKYSLRFSIYEDLEFEQRLDTMLNFCRNARIDDVMFFINAEELNNGHITVEESAPYIRAICRAKNELKKLGITTSVNPWTSIHHDMRGRKLKDGQDFSLMVDWKGVKDTGTACFTCGNWKKYIIELWNCYLKEIQPDTLWIEDDFRLSNHGTMYYGGCFCDEHMRRYNAELKEELTRGEFIERLLSTEVHAAEREAFLRVNRRLIQDTLKDLKEGLNLNGCALSVMTGSVGFSEGREPDKEAEILSRGRRAANRVSLWTYRQCEYIEYAWKMQLSGMQMSYFVHNQADLMPEIENVPHSPYTKSVDFTIYQLESCIPMGASGATFSIFDFVGNGALDWGYSDRLSKAKDYFNAAHRLNLQSLERTGIKIPINRDNLKHVKIKEKDCGKPEALNSKDAWWAGYLGLCGIAYEFCEHQKFSGETLAVGSEYLRGLTRAEAEDLFADNFVILNGDAAITLTQLNWQDLSCIESVRTVTGLSGEISYEECTGELNLLGIKRARAGSQLFLNNFDDVDGEIASVKYRNDGGVKIYSKHFNYMKQPVISGFALVNNKTLIMPLMSSSFKYYLVLQFREQLLKHILRTNKAPQLLYTQNIGCIPYVRAGDGFDYIAVMNYTEDAWKNLSIYSGKRYSRFEVLNRESLKFEDCKYTESGGTYTFGFSAAPLKALILKAYK